MSKTQYVFVTVKFKKRFRKIHLGCNTFRGPFKKGEYAELPGEWFNILVKKDVIENKIVPTFKLYGGYKREKTE